jgi:Tol biopolymer transport system component
MAGSLWVAMIGAREGVTLVVKYGPRACVRRPHSNLRLCVLVALVALFASVLLVGGARSASEPSGLIAFARPDGIYVMRADGSGVRALRRGGVATQPRDLAWSRDGSRLLFVGRTDGIWAMDADGSNLVRVAAGRSPAWSPDGRRVAFTKYGNRGYIWVVDADGGYPHRLVKASLFVWDVDWHPTADNRLVFSTGGYVSAIYVVSANGGNRRNIAPGLRDSVVDPAWSPDGRRIAFSSNWSMKKAELYAVGAAGGVPVRLTHNSVFDGAPTWSPDGHRIAFVRSTGKGPTCANCPPGKLGTGEIYVVNADGTGVTRLTHNQVGEGSPAWQPVAAS